MACEMVDGRTIAHTELKLFTVESKGRELSAEGHTARNSTKA